MEALAEWFANNEVFQFKISLEFAALAWLMWQSHRRLVKVEDFVIRAEIKESLDVRTD